MSKLLGRWLVLSGLLVAYLLVPAGSGAGVNGALGCVAHAAPATDDQGFEDGNTLTPAESAALKQESARYRDAHPAAKSPAGAFTVPVVWNVFYDQNNPSDGNFPDSVVTQTMNVVNSFFSPVGLSFQVQAVNRVAAPHTVVHGAAQGNSVEKQLKQYRRGTVQTLNIYTVGHNTNHDLAGWATFPWDYQSQPQSDGVVYDYDFLPGGKHNGYNTGKIMAHEIGHWVGLLHTFQDGCDGGDQVDDTPAEATPAHGCPDGRDTCSAAGADPIHNMMDYSGDACRTRFTNGQYNRLAQVLHQYRGINLY